MSDLKERLKSLTANENTLVARIFKTALILFAITAAIVGVISSMIDAKSTLAIVIFEIIIAVAFAAELAIRIITAENKKEYLLSFFGFVDILSIFPIILAIFAEDGTLFYRIVIAYKIMRSMKVLRYFSETKAFLKSVKENAKETAMFFLASAFILMLLASVMYASEGGTKGFDGVLKSMYWAVGVLTTNGYVGSAPQTIVGKVVSALTMLLGFIMIIVPSGLFMVHMSRALDKKKGHKLCKLCGLEMHEADAKYCKNCGWKL